MKFILASLFVFASATAFADPLQPGLAAPCIALEQIDKAGSKSTQTTCAASVAGKKIVLEFFATWCVYCVQNMPKFEELASKHNDKAEFRIVGLDGTAAELDRFFAPRAMDGYSLVYDLQATSATAFGIVGIPSLYVIGADGQIVLFHEGTIDTDEQMKAVEDAIIH